jgi:BA14K-like protein
MESNMASKIALRLAAFAIGAAFASAPALAQQTLPSSQSSGRLAAPNVQARSGATYLTSGAQLQLAQYWRWGPRRWPWGGGYFGFAPGAYYDYWMPAASNVAWCEAHFRSYNPTTGMYLGYDGQYHFCP